MMKHKTTLKSAEKLDVLEAQLAGTLKPFAPPRDIVKRLRLRLHMPDRQEITLRLADWRRLFLVLSGVISGALLLITIARALYYLIGRKGAM
jgi:hypothetical protein